MNDRRNFSYYGRETQQKIKKAIRDTKEYWLTETVKKQKGQKKKMIRVIPIKKSNLRQVYTDLSKLDGQQTMKRTHNQKEKWTNWRKHL